MKFQNSLKNEFNPTPGELWDFKFLAETSADIGAVVYDDRLPVPSAFDAFPAYAGKRGVGIYRCFAEITPWRGAVLKFGGAGMRCSVFADGALIAEHIGTYTPFEVRIPAAQHARREIAVACDNRYDYEKCPLHENYFDFYNYGGIIREVTLKELSQDAIRNVKVTVENLEEGIVRVETEFYGEAAPLRFSFDGGAFQTAPGPLFTAKVPSPSLWSPETPNLHTLTVDSGDDSMTVRFGLREVRAENGKILLNGKPVKLLGFCRHEAHPQFGPALPLAQLVSDLQLLKDMGCNFVRGSHYQQDPRFLDLCDEAGMLVFEESLGWGQAIARTSDPKFIEAQLAQTEAMIESGYNHPSVIMRGFLNEGASDKEESRECYEKLAALIKRKDPSRLMAYASNKELKDKFLELADVVCLNLYPGWYSGNSDDEHPVHEVKERMDSTIKGLEKRGLSGKPFIISEIGAAALYGWRDPLNGYWTEEYQAELLGAACRETVDNPRIAGIAIWQFCDCRTYQGPRALMRARAFNNKGVMDEYRRPKLAYKTVKEIFEGYKQR
jgi:beta-glucuronidase